MRPIGAWVTWEPGSGFGHNYFTGMVQSLPPPRILGSRGTTFFTFAHGLSPEWGNATALTDYLIPDLPSRNGGHFFIVFSAKKPIMINDDVFPDSSFDTLDNFS